jgi:amino acid transporter
MLTGVVDSGGAIGAGLFIGSGGAFQSGGPGSVLIGFMIVGESPLTA